MNRTTLTVGLCLLGSAGFGAAQSKQSGVGKCEEKPEISQPAEVGDRANHRLVLTKQACTWTTPMEMGGLKSKSYVITVLSDVAGTRSQDRGYVVTTMDNGDKAYVRFQGASTFPAKEGEPGTGEGTWTYTGGTGKLRGLTGKGTYKSANSEDHVDGEWAIAEPKKK
ncbi:MAG TPA: hypothetical protein VE959_23360 [Bryobacteraceae bacterium]|nr:hypothetical protein [Bryobacteraceae bacterium]